MYCVVSHNRLGIFHFLLKISSVTRKPGSQRSSFTVNDGSTNLLAVGEDYDWTSSRCAVVLDPQISKSLTLLHPSLQMDPPAKLDPPTFFCT